MKVNGLGGYYIWFGCYCKDVFQGPHVTRRVFDETLFRIFAKRETRENAPEFRETFASFAKSNFRDFCVL
jgi:hypothetical protein